MMSPSTLTIVLTVSKIRSIGNKMAIASAGKPTDCNTITIVTIPALGIPQENAQIALIQQKYRDLKLAGSFQEEQSITAIKQTFSDQRNLIAEQEAAKTKDLEEQKLFNSLDTNNQLLS